MSAEHLTNQSGNGTAAYMSSEQVRGKVSVGSDRPFDSASRFVERHRMPTRNPLLNRAPHPCHARRMRHFHTLRSRTLGRRYSMKRASSCEPADLADAL